MKIRYIYSACVSIATEDCTVLCDPWFGEAYDGSWVQWQRIENPLDVCGPADYVYISHVHPDHYDPGFLKQYLATYPQARVVIARQEPPLLERKLRSRGIQPIVVPVTTGLTIGGTTMWALANRANGGLNIDSALVVSDGRCSVANLNDNPYDDNQVKAIKLLCPNLHPTVALLPFVGAGPWPQCYHFDDPADQLKAAEAKKQKYLDLFSRYCQALQPHVAVPFAGQYWLYRENLSLNPLRGMADATECIGLHDYVWVPADGGQSTLDVEQRTSTSCRKDPYDWGHVRGEIMLQTSPSLTAEHWMYRYEREIQVPVERLPLLKLLGSAVANAFPKFKNRQELHICIKTQLPNWFHFSNSHWTVGELLHGGELRNEPRVEVFIDARYLFGMLTRLYNANSVRIGSLCRFKCVPAEYDKELDDLFGEYWDSLRV